MEKYGTVRQATDDSTIRRMRFACWITKAVDTHSGCVMIFHGKNSYAKAPQNITLQYIVYIVFCYVQILHQFRCTQQKVPGKSHVRSTLQNCGSSVCNLLYVTIWRLGFCKCQSTLFRRYMMKGCTGNARLFFKGEKRT